MMSGVKSYWSRVKERYDQWSPTQRRMAVCIIGLLALNIGFVVNIAVPQQHLPQIHPKFRRTVDAQQDDDAGGAIYTRWGKTECPEEAELIYAGVTGGELNDYEGGGASYMCLPLDPDYDYKGNPTPSGSKYSYMYGTEYHSLDETLGKAVENHNVPCAVCQSLNRKHLLMVPAKNKCYPGWHLEYKGYLVTEDYRHKNNKVVECLDDEAKTDQAGYREEQGPMMSRVKGMIGSLPSPPYENLQPLTCVVCTK